jgi:small-conductance mechanosensitive channel
MVVVGVPLFSVAAGAALSGGHWAVATATLVLLAGLLGLGIMLLVTRPRSN